MESIKTYSNMTNTLWDKEISSFQNVTFDYTSERIEYDLEYLSERLISNESFVLTAEKNKILSVVYITEIDNIIEMSYASGNLPSPLFFLESEEVPIKKITQKWYKHILSLSKKYNVSAIRFSCNPLALQVHSNLRFNWLLMYGFDDMSYNTQLIDLTIPIEKIWSGYDKTTRYDIKNSKGLVEIIDDKNITMDDIEEYRAMHFDAAGRQTRSIQTFEIMYQWIKSGKSVLVFYNLNGNRISVVLVTIFNKLASYGSAATLTSHKKLNGVGEKIQDSIVRYLKIRKCHLYEMGNQYFDADIKRLSVDLKAVQISKYKRKFGGFTSPIFAGKKLL